MERAKEAVSDEQNLDRNQVSLIVKDFMSALEDISLTTVNTTLVADTKSATIIKTSSISGDAVGTISFNGDYRGQLILGFSKEAICELTTNMLSSAKKYSNHRNPDVQGALGEITNQVAGRARLKVNKRTGWEASNGVPSIIVGDRIGWDICSKKSVVIHLPYKTSTNNILYMEIALYHHPSVEKR
ncbi:MAG: chemotaxis protein CheX [Nitrospinota bacterium]